MVLLISIDLDSKLKVFTNMYVGIGLCRYFMSLLQVCSVAIFSVLQLSVTVISQELCAYISDNRLGILLTLKVK